ncbi:MAG: MalY/PatB family protein [Fermentimonas sp.]|jgi:cystathionine beta-lyase
MKYNFDEIIDRSKTSCDKLEMLEDLFGRKDLIPLWVADMDFKSPSQIIDALRERVEHGVFGYTSPDDAYYNSVINWLRNKHNWNVDKGDISFLEGVVKGFSIAIEVFTEIGDNVIIQPPVYHPFRLSTEALGRKVLNNNLLFEDGKYEMDFEGLKDIIANNECKLLILCNPHNPGGVLWPRESLEELAEICYDNDVLVVSDEIHADMALYGKKHIPFASVSEKAAQNSITLMAPSKTFNIAGIISSFYVIKNKDIRNKYSSFVTKRGFDRGSIFSYLATRVAYDECGDWLDNMLKYVESNIDFVSEYLEKNIPSIKAILPGASFLIWLDCRGLGLNQKDLVDFFVNDCGLALNDGSMFGPGGEGFMRMNVGTPRKNIEMAMSNLKEAVERRF